METVKLNNGEFLGILQEPEAITICRMTREDKTQIDCYICQITPSGVIVYGNSNDGAPLLTEGLGYERNRTR